MPKPIFVCYATGDDFYQMQVRRLEKSLQAFGLEHRIETHDRAGDWF